LSLVDYGFSFSCGCADLFESIYYFSSVAKFIAEVKRILRPGGVFLCSSVNCEWRGFNPSLYSIKYHTVEEIKKDLELIGFKTKFY
jgi:SAM-dependent methyltransferase